MQGVPQDSVSLRLVRCYGLVSSLLGFLPRRVAAACLEEISGDEAAQNRHSLNPRAIFAAVVGVVAILGLVGISGCAGGFQGAKALDAVAPTVTQPANQTVMVGQTATFSVTASGTGPLTYQWYKNGVAD